MSASFSKNFDFSILDAVVENVKITDMRDIGNETTEEEVVEVPKKKKAKKGIQNTFELAKEYAGDGVISRTHFAKALIKLGAVANFEQAFKKYLGKGKGAYVTPEWMEVEDAVRLIKEAEGLSVIAHPIRYDLSNKWLRKLVAEFASAGGDALEVGLTQMSPDQRKFISSLATEHDLYSSQGSDFHGPTRWTELGRGLHLSETCRPVWTHDNWNAA